MCWLPCSQLSLLAYRVFQVWGAVFELGLYDTLLGQGSLASVVLGMRTSANGIVAEDSLNAGLFTLVFVLKIRAS